MNYFESRESTPVMSAGQAATAALPTPADVASLLTDGLLRPVVEGLAAAAGNLSDSMSALGRTPSRGTGRTRGKKECDCEHADPCHCRCCIVDADLVLYARIGETRVVPLVIENKWRRERDIKLELSEFTTHGGAAGVVKAQLLAPAPAFKIPPCGEQAITMVVQAIVPGGTETPGQTRLPDVDNCTVYYADLRVAGCDIRPIRIAIAFLPRDCSAYRIECACACCC